MPLYGVRLTKNKEAVGLLYAESIKELGWLVDQVTDPADCQYKKVFKGGVIWPAFTPEVFREGEEETLIVDAYLDEYSTSSLYSDKNWKEFGGAEKWNHGK